AAPPAAPPFELVGTIVNATSAIALVRNPSNDTVNRIRIGDEAFGWRVRSVATRSILVENGAQSVTLGFPPPQDATSGDQPPPPNVTLNDDSKNRRPNPQGE